jgi:hypothetical protein
MKLDILPRHEVEVLPHDPTTNKLEVAYRGSTRALTRPRALSLDSATILPAIGRVILDGARVADEKSFGCWQIGKGFQVLYRRVTRVRSK